MQNRIDLLPKPMKREIRQLAEIVHERLLALELRKLDGQFARWRTKEIDAFELAADIHKFHEGPPRRLWLAFNTNSVSLLILRVKEGVAEGMLEPKEISDELRAVLETIPLL
ncbi:MAG: hypothetical protein HYX27_17525 [Acidobacteria bacterium]|nr:hypothetical protein [Acidobacteriota bacterium]